MNLEQQLKMCDEFFNDCADLLATKGRDYTPGNRAFESSIAAADAAGIRVEQVLWVNASKHIAAIAGVIRSGQDLQGEEKLREKLRDLANYCALIDVWWVHNRANRSD